MKSMFFSLTIPQFCLLTLITFLGILIGIYISLALINAGRIRRKSKNVKYLRVGNENEEYPPSSRHQPIQQEESTSVEHDSLLESKYTEGMILEQKLKRDGVSLFDLNCAAKDEDPEDRVRARQRKEDDSYTILRNGG